MSPHVAVIAGTRPEIIKLAPVIDAIDALLGPGTARVIDTGQHDDPAMSGQIWTGLGMAEPSVRLAAGGRSRAGCIGYLTAELGDLLSHDPPAAVVVQGDTNSTVAGALAANAEGLPLVHVEAGLRSSDRAMPEEHNRIVTDHLADLCCAATPLNAANLRAEGIAPDRIVLTGNTIVEGVQRQLARPHERLVTLRRYGVQVDRYVLSTIHRPENTDDPDVLQAVLMELDRLARRLPVVAPLHPRTRRSIDRIGAAALLRRLTVTGPLPVGAFLSLAAHAAVLVSDSGGVAEEATVLKRPLVVVRRSTERAESVRAGFAWMARPSEIESATLALLSSHRSLLERLAATPSPYGDGYASVRVAGLVGTLVSNRGGRGV